MRHDIVSVVSAGVWVDECASVLVYVCVMRGYVPSSEASLDVRLPTNPLLYVRVSLLVPGSGNTPIKAVLHGHANNSGWHIEAGHGDRV